ncbi:MAG: hypothetical protein RMA76_00545 [Deltaproteobacteria bacterium]
MRPHRTSPGWWARFVAFVARPWTGGRTRRLATLRMRAEAAGEDARELVRTADAFREEEELELAARTFWRAVHVHRRRDEHTKALAVLKRVVALSPNEPSARTAIGECLERLERRAEAADHFRHAARLAAHAQRPNAAKQLDARADRLCPRGPRKLPRGASVLAEDLRLPSAAQPSLRNEPAPQPSLRDDRAPAAQPGSRAPAAQPSLRDDRAPAAQPGSRAPAVQPSLRDNRDGRAPVAQPSSRAPALQPSLRDNRDGRAPAAQPSSREPAAQPSLRDDRNHRASAAQPNLRDDHDQRAAAAQPGRDGRDGRDAPLRSAPEAPPSPRAPVVRTSDIIAPGTPPPAPRRVVAATHDANAPELPEVSRWPSVPRPRAATPRLEYTAPEPDPVVARPRRRAEALFRSEETAPVHGTGTELALDAEALLLDDDPAEAATAKAAPRSPLDAVQAPVVFDAPTTNYAPMMLEDLLQSEEETVTTAPIDPLRCAS